MGTNLREQILSEENIYKAIFAVESYVSERDLLSVSDLNKFLQLRDKYDFNGTILTVINSCKKTLTKLLDDENELLKVNVFFKQKSYFIRQTWPKTARHFFRIRVIFLLASRLLASTTLIYRWVVVILLCAMMLWMVRMSVPAAACSVANVLR